MDPSFIASTATGGSTSQLIDTVRLQRANWPAERYKDAWIYFTATGDLVADNNTREVQTYAPSTGTCTQDGPVWSTAVTSSMTYELHKLLDPRDWNAAITRGLRKCTRRRREAITVVANQLQYALTSYTWFEGRQQMLQVWHRTGSTANEYRFDEMPPWMWDIIEDDNGYTLSFKNALSTASADAYFFDAIGPFDALTTENHATTGTTSCPLDWIVAATIVSAYELYGNRIEQGVRAITKEDAFKEFAALTSRFAPQWSEPFECPD